MSRAYEVHIYQQLHPDEVLITGNAKRHRPIWAMQQEADREYIRKHGLEAWQQKMKEYNQKPQHHEPHTD